MESKATTSVFLDTGHVVVLANRRDRHHQKALELAEQVSRDNIPVVTTQAVLVEGGNALASVKNRSFAVKYVEAVERTPTFEVVYSTIDLFHRSLALYRERQDKSWGMTDCISFVVMRDRGLRDAPSTDRDFEQAGFNVLLRA